MATEGDPVFKEWKEGIPTLSPEERIQDMLEYLLDPGTIQRDNYKACKDKGEGLFYWLDGKWVDFRE